MSLLFCDILFVVQNVVKSGPVSLLRGRLWKTHYFLSSTIDNTHLLAKYKQSIMAAKYEEKSDWDQVITTNHKNALYLMIKSGKISKCLSEITFRSTTKSPILKSNIKSPTIISPYKYINHNLNRIINQLI